MMRYGHQDVATNILEECKIHNAEIQMLQVFGLLRMFKHLLQDHVGCVCPGALQHVSNFMNTKSTNQSLFVAVCLFFYMVILAQEQSLANPNSDLHC